MPDGSGLPDITVRSAHRLICKALKPQDLRQKCSSGHVLVYLKSDGASPVCRRRVAAEHPFDMMARSTERFIRFDCAGVRPTTYIAASCYRMARASWPVRWAAYLERRRYLDLKRCLSICSALIFDSSVDDGTPSRAAAPNGPDTRPLLSLSAASMTSFSRVANVEAGGLATAGGFG